MVTKAELEYLILVPKQLKEISKQLERIAIALEKSNVSNSKDGGK